MAPIQQVWFDNGYGKNITIVHNTLVNTAAIDLCNGAACTDPSAGVTFANNLFYQSDPAATKSIHLSEADYSGAVSMTGNLYAVPASTALGLASAASVRGWTAGDPMLSRSANGMQLISSALSRAIGGASAAYLPVASVPFGSLPSGAWVNSPAWAGDAAIALDATGKPRPADATQKHIGADQYTGGPPGVINRPLTLADVGPLSPESLLPVSCLGTAQTPDVCGAACVSFKNDTSNCGRCGLSCQPGFGCANGTCTSR